MRKLYNCDQLFLEFSNYRALSLCLMFVSHLMHCIVGIVNKYCKLDNNKFLTCKHYNI